MPNETNCLCEFIPLRNTVLRWLGFFSLIPSDHFNERNKLANTTKCFHLKAIKTEMLKTLEE